MVKTPAAWACVLTMAVTSGQRVAVHAAQVRGSAPAQTAESYLQQGDRFSQDKQYDKAVDAYKQAIRVNATLAAAYHGLGAVYLRMGRTPDALEPFQTAVRLEPQNAIAHLNLGITLAALRRPDEALVEMNDAKQLNPLNGSIHNEIGKVLFNLGQLDTALVENREAVRLSPAVPEAHHNVGLTLMRLGRYADAVEPFETALRLNPTFANARFYLGDAYSRLGRYPESIDSWTKFLVLVPDGPQATERRAWDYMYAGGQGAAAAADARHSLDLVGWRDSSSPYMVLLAYLGATQGASGDARAVLDEASRRCDTTAWPYPVIRYLRAELTAADLLRAATTNDRRTEARTYIGMDLLRQGDTDGARTHFQWVRDYGNKRFMEYPLAAAELARLGY